MKPNLSPEQKEHIRIAQRNERRVEETWALYTMFLSQNKEPPEALRRAVEAVEVWAEYDDSNVVEYPEIDHPDFADQMTGVMGKMIQQLKPSALRSTPDLAPQSPPTKEEPHA
jgi:hypothetical protein